MGERITALETWTEGHEQRCEDRVAAIAGQVKSIAARVDKLIYALVMFLVGIAGWMAVQLYVLQPLRVQVTATPPAQVSVTPRP